MRVNIIELKQILNLLLNKLENKYGEVLDLDVDFYWDIAFDEVYNPYEEPKNISLGQLSDDLDVITKLYYNSNNIVIYDLKRIAEILKAISVNPAIGDI